MAGPLSTGYSDLRGDFSRCLNMFVKTPLLHVDECLSIDAGKGRQIVDKIHFIDCSGKNRKKGMGSGKLGQPFTMVKGYLIDASFPIQVIAY